MEITKVAAVVVFGACMAGLDTSLVNVGLTTISAQLHAGIDSTQWISSGYLLALAAALPACPWLMRRVGGKKLWLAALAVFCIASAVCAVAPALSVLIFARVVQGAAGGLLVPAGQSLLGRAAGPARMGRVMSTAGIAVVLAPAVGPALGGLLIDQISWRWLFLVNVPIGAVALFCGYKLLPPETPRGTERLDVTGLVLLGAGLPLFSLGVIELGDEPGRRTPLAYLLVGAAALSAFVWLTVRRVRHADHAKSPHPPLIDLTLFTRRPYLAAQVTVLFTGFSLFGGLILLPLYYESLRGESATSTGLLLLAYGGGAAVALWVGGVVTDKIGGGISCVVGLVITIAATVPFVWLPAEASLPVVETLQFVRGAGVGMAGLPAMSAAFAAAADRIEDATTTANILQRVGGSLGSALLVIVVSDRPTQNGFQMAFAVLVAGAAVALIAAAWLAYEQHRQRLGQT